VTRTVTAELAEAIATNVGDGDTVFVGGFGHLIPFAAAHEIMRQGRRDLTVCRSGADIVVDELIGAGAVGRVIVGWIGNPGIGLAHAFTRAVAAGTIEVEEWTNFAMLLRLHAGALGVPFLPTYTLRGGDVPGASADVRTVTCPFTGAALAAVPALRPDVALIHAQRASASGDVQMWGILGDTVVGAMASARIVVTVEELVDEQVIRSAPERTVIPGYRVAAVCVVPGGARPSYAMGYYGRDDAAYRTYDQVARDPAALAAYLAAGAAASGPPG
jgi:glutaconate CoA-transferase, subunit A